MKRTEQPAQNTQPAKSFRTQSAGLYGEVVVLPVRRAGPAPLNEPKTFL